MTDFVSTWNNESFLTYPVGPLGLIAMPGTQILGEKVNSWLKKWRDHTEESMGDMSTTPGAEREDFLIRISCPRFGNGEGKGMIKETIRGYDLYILCDVGAYNETWAYVDINNIKGYVQIASLSRTAYTTLERGNSGESVGKLQSMLLVLGYFDGLPGSSYDSATESAVKRFQQQLGMTETGKADASTMRVLVSGVAPACTLLSGKYAKGSSGSNVSRIQTRLYSLGYLSKSSSIDGDYGTTTQTAVKDFQSANSITSSGTRRPLSIISNTSL